MAAPTIEDSGHQFKSFHIEKDKELGSGAFSQVFAATINGLSGAAKLLHGVEWDSLFTKSSTTSSSSSMMGEEQSQGEWNILRALRHPCVIQHLGIVQDSETGLPALLMERAVCSLTTLLQYHASSGSLPQQMQVQLIHDITRGVAYLHSNYILHRDLSSNNILITTGTRAKVSDFGTAVVLKDKERRFGLRAWPGTLVYMPPEAAPYHCNSLHYRTGVSENQSSNLYSHKMIQETGIPASICHGNQHPGRLDQTAACSTNPFPHSKLHLAYYGYKMDIFSLGVLTVQICTRKSPNPGSPFRKVRKEDKEEGAMERVPEVLRRHSHLQLMGRSHPLLPLARNCLKDREVERPSAQQLCKDIETLIS